MSEPSEQVITTVSKKRKYTKISPEIRSAIFCEFFKLYHFTTQGNYDRLDFMTKLHMKLRFNNAIDANQLARYWLNYRRFVHYPSFFRNPYPLSKYYHLKDKSASIPTLSKRIAKIGTRYARNWRLITLYDIQRELKRKYKIVETIQRIDAHLHKRDLKLLNINVSWKIKLEHRDKITIADHADTLRKYEILIWKGVVVPQTDSMIYISHKWNGDRAGGIYESWFNKSLFRWYVRITTPQVLPVINCSNEIIKLGDAMLSRSTLHHNQQFDRYMNRAMRNKMSESEIQHILDEEKVLSGGREVRLWSKKYSVRYVSEYAKDMILGTQTTYAIRVPYVNRDKFVKPRCSRFCRCCENM
jgi:hypothetical protein